MRISKTQFYIITLLFFLLPISANWRLFLFGKRTTGIVIQPKITEVLTGNTERRSIIYFETPNRHYYIYGPEDAIYPIGKEIRIIYRESKPEDYILLNFTGLLLTNKTIIPLVLLILWLSFYLSVKQSQKKQYRIKKMENRRKLLNRGKKSIK